MTERALAADAAKSQFLATVSHEVRTPLNGVIGMASVVLAGELPTDARRNVSMIRTSGLHLLDVINRLLDYARIDHPYSPQDVAAFDLPSMVEEVLAEARFSPHADGLALRSEIEPGLVACRSGYRQGLLQVLTNLVGNGTRFTDRGAVTVRLSDRGGDALRIEVADTGVGIPDAMQARIFLPFDQGDSVPARRRGGTGLGLSISAEIVRRMGGTIGVDSQPGAGACFWVELRLPAVASPERRTAPATA
jgi:signal transduction histidine kinase